MTAKQTLRLRTDFTQDANQHTQNANELERWSRSPKDSLALIDFETLPTASDYPEGSIIRVGSDLYQQSNDVWIKGWNATTFRHLTKTIDLPNVGAGASISENVASTDVQANDLVIYVNGLTTTGLVMRAIPPANAGSFDMKISNLTAGAINQASTTFDFLIVTP